MTVALEKLIVLHKSIALLARDMFDFIFCLTVPFENNFLIELFIFHSITLVRVLQRGKV